LSDTEAQATPHYYPWRMPTGWWTRNRHYFLYTVREFTSLPLAIWLLWLLWDIYNAPHYQAMVKPALPAFAIFSIICLPFALYHSWTFLSLAGTIIHLKVLDRPVSSRVIVASQFAAWIGASVVIGFLLVWLAK
jgi:fumarate reductase subunit C